MGALTFLCFFFNSFFFHLKLIAVYCVSSMWGKITIPMYRLWLHGLYGLYGPWCSLSPKRPLNLITHSLSLMTLHPHPFSISLSHSQYHPRSLTSSFTLTHYIDVIMTTVASQITSLTVVYSIVYSDADKRKHQSSGSLAFVTAQMASYAENVSIWWRHHDLPSQADEARSHLHTMGISVSRDCNVTQVTAY